MSCDLAFIHALHLQVLPVFMKHLLIVHVFKFVLCKIPLGELALSSKALIISSILALCIICVQGLKGEVPGTLCYMYKATTLVACTIVTAC